MHPIYWLQSPSAHPKPPEHWSYSSLRAWRLCPRKWWLERCAYPNIESSYYPVPVNAGALEGQLVHQVVEEWGKALRRGDDPGSMRPRFKAALHKLFAELKKNPRVDAGRVIAAISLDACVAKAFNFIRDLESVPSGNDASRGDSQGGSSTTPSRAEELWLAVDDPPLKGQLDRVRNGVVTDYKTSEPDSGHADQVLFYAVLWWLKYEELPISLELRYPGSVVEVPVPGHDELDAMVMGFRSEIAAANAAIEQGNTLPLPAVESCRYCPVRQLCDDYWDSPDTAELRLVNFGTGTNGASQVRYGDVQISELPAEKRSDGAVIGEGLAEGIGVIHVQIAAHCCPSAEQRASIARMLGAKMTYDRGTVTVTTSPTTEVFWKNS